MWYGEEAHIKECTDFQTNLIVGIVNLSKMFFSRVT